jgi:acetolactate synthase-1/2/3 large subunit
VIYIVLNDSRLGMVAHGQQLGGGEEIGCELPHVDFRRLAEALGVRAYLIQTPQDLMNLNIPGICQQSSPTLLDVRIDPREVPPIGRRIQVLQEL